ncbi:mitochondrial carrier, partial [Haematococcus lacustris]
THWRQPLAALGKDIFLGLAEAIYTTIPAGLLFFATDEACKQLLTKVFNKDRRHPGVHLVSAASAALVSATVRVPGDVLKHRVQAYMYNNMWQGAVRTLKQQGIKGLYCGFRVTLLRDVPEMALQFTLYEALSRASSRWAVGQPSDASQAPSPARAHPLLLGGVAGACAAVVTTPLDVLKTQLQCSHGCSLSGALRTVLQARGWPGLLAGLRPRVLQASIQSAVFFTAFEALKKGLAWQLAAEQQAGLQHDREERVQLCGQLEWEGC